jgi:hypothetical protein
VAYRRAQQCQHSAYLAAYAHEQGLLVATASAATAATTRVHDDEHHDGTARPRHRSTARVAPARQSETLAEGRLCRSPTVPPVTQPIGYCPAPCHIATGSGSGESEPKEEQEQPEQDAEGDEDGRHLETYLKRSPGGRGFLPASARSRPTQDAEGRRGLGEAG